MADRVPTWSHRGVVRRGRRTRPQAIRRLAGPACRATFPIRRQGVPDRRALPPLAAMLAALLLLAWAEAPRALPTGTSTGSAVAYAWVDDPGAAPDAAIAPWPGDALADTTPLHASAHLPGDATLAASMPLGAPALAVWYGQAAADYGVSGHLLRALHHVESNAAPDGCVANLEGSGAVGPFQFKPATFGQYGVDANHDGIRDRCAFADALFSAARYLRALGADDLDSPATRTALARYGTDPDRVLVLARQYRDLAAQQP